LTYWKILRIFAYKLKTMRKERYILLLDGVEIGRASSITNLGKLIGCTKQHIYHQLEEGFFKYNKNIYKIIDRLD
jgi:hypothetical protein